MLESISNAQLNEWLAYYQIEPFGEERADYRTAQICALIEAVNTKKRKLDIQGWLPIREEQHQSKHEIWAKLKQITQAMGGWINGEKQRPEGPASEKDRP